MKEYLPLFGRMGLALIFIILGLEKALNFMDAAALMTENGIPISKAILVISICIEVVGGVLIVMGYRTSPVAMIMACYLLITTFVFHPFWLHVNHMEVFLRNLAIFGGLLLLAYHGPGPKSVDSVHLW